MANQNERANKFIKAINEGAYLQQKLIKEETAQFCEHELSKARQRAHDEIDEITARERDAVRSEISRKYSALSNDSRRKMLLHREEIMKSVFEDTAKKLLEFAASDKYKPWLINAVSKAAAKVNADDMVLLLRKCDEKYAADIAAAVSYPFTVSIDEDNTLGGFKIVSKSRGICANDTLESRLEDNHDWFLSVFSSYMG